VHKDAVHLLSLQPKSITSSGAFKPECNDLSQFREDTGGPSMPVREFNRIAHFDERKMNGKNSHLRNSSVNLNNNSDTG